MSKIIKPSPERLFNVLSLEKLEVIPKKSKRKKASTPLTKIVKFRIDYPIYEAMKVKSNTLNISISEYIRSLIYKDLKVSG
jgi:hypothetical protein